MSGSAVTISTSSHEPQDAVRSMLTLGEVHASLSELGQSQGQARWGANQQMCTAGLLRTSARIHCISAVCQFSPSLVGTKKMTQQLPWVLARTERDLLRAPSPGHVPDDQQLVPTLLRITNPQLHNRMVQKRRFLSCSSSAAAIFTCPLAKGCSPVLLSGRGQP